MMKKRRPSLGVCGVKPLSREIHQHLIASYIMWPVLIVMGGFSTHISFYVAVCASFLVLGFLFYNLLVAMVQMAHDEKKRLRISQWIFYITLGLLTLRLMWIVS
ncbi:hypothetical protein [Oceaniferula spumae]